MHAIWKLFPAFLALSLFGSQPIFADDWPQWLGPERDSVWRETGIVRKFPTNGPSVRWRTSVAGGYSGPAVAGGRVYVTDRLLAQGVSNPTDPFKTGVIAGSERILCLEQSTGKILWQYQYDCRRWACRFLRRRRPGDFGRIYRPRRPGCGYVGQFIHC